MRSRSYTTYSIAVAVVWAVLLLAVSVSASSSTRDNVYKVFAGFAIGWISATIARWVYPPPKRYREDPPVEPESSGGGAV